MNAKNYTVYIFITLISFCFYSCGKGSEFNLSGKLNGNGKNIYIVYDDPIAKIDTVKLINGEFSYSFIPDTITMLRLVNDSGIAIPVFADKGWKVDIEGNFITPKVKGNGPNQQLQDFRNKISALREDSADIKMIQSLAEEFITANRQSYASAYILNNYFIQTANPNLEKIKALIAQLDGHVKDCRVIDVIQKEISEKENKSDNKYLPYFSCKKRDGEYISWSSKDNLYTLVNVWASWNKESMARRDSLYSKLSKMPKKEFRVLNISVDYDKAAWNESCKKDTTQWIEVCDFKGWENQIIKQSGIKSIPYNILVDKSRKIIATNINGSELIDKLKELTDKK